MHKRRKHLAVPQIQLFEDPVSLQTPSVCQKCPSLHNLPQFCRNASSFKTVVKRHFSVDLRGFLSLGLPLHLIHFTIRSPFPFLYLDCVAIRPTPNHEHLEGNDYILCPSSLTSIVEHRLLNLLWTRTLRGFAHPHAHPCPHL